MRTSRWTDAIPLSDVGGAWVFPERAVLYTESKREIPTVEDANTLFDFFVWVADHVPTHRPATVIHDWRSMRSLPRAVRSVFIQRRRQIVMRPSRVVLALTINPMLRMAMQTVALGAQLLAQAVELDFVNDTEAVLRDLALPDPDPSLHARLRLAWKHARS